MSRLRRTSLRAALAALATAATAAMATLGCEDAGNRMRDTPRYEALERSVMGDRTASARRPPEGTVARGDWVENRPYHTGLTADGKFVRKAPIEVNEAVLRRGRQRYEIYCTPCHGFDGDGDGIVPARGYTPPPSFHIERLRRETDGDLFTTVTHGFGRMPSYASQVPVADRWAIIAYIRALQLSQHAPASRLSDAEMAKLEASGGEVRR